MRLSSQPINFYFTFHFSFTLCSFTYFMLLRHLKVLASHFHKSRNLNLMSVRKMDVMMDQQSSVDEDLPPVYIASRIEGIGEKLKELNNKLVIKEVTIDLENNVLQKSEIEQAEIMVCDASMLCENYQKMPLLKWAHCTWAGVEPVYKAINTKPSFIITRHVHENLSTQMAEYVLAHVINYEKYFYEIYDAYRNTRSWKLMRLSSVMGNNRNLDELTIGVLGVGYMGQTIANFFKKHGTRLIGFAKTPREPSQFGSFDNITNTLSEVLSEVDYIVNTLPSTPETVGLLDGDVLKDCKKAPVFINVGRGDIIQEDTLYRALESRHKWLSHAILDVFYEEPPSEKSELWVHHKVTMTPHCAAQSTAKGVAEDFFNSLSDFQQKKPLKHMLDWEKRY